MAFVENMDVDYAIDISDETNRQIIFWNSLKKKIELIYNDDPKVDLTFLTTCYDDVYDFVMFENRQQIELRNLGMQQFYPGKTQDLSRELYYYLIGFINEKTEIFAEVCVIT